MTKLSQFGNWSPDLEAKAREIMLLRYSESSDDVLDFKICQRGDGSTYGIGKAKNCVQGVEVSRADIVRQLLKAGVDQRTIARLNTSAKSDEEFAKEAQDLRPKTVPEKQPAKKENEKSEVIKAKRENKIAKDTEPKSRLEKILADAGVEIEELSPKELQNRVKVLELYNEKYGPEATQKLANSLSTLLNTSIDRKATSLSPEEVKVLQNPELQEKLLAGFLDPPSLIGGKNAVIPFKEIDELTFNASWALLSENMRNSFSSAGKTNKNAWKGFDENGDPINGGDGNQVRGKELFKLWLRQDGKCAYTGLPLTRDFADLEHIVPMKQIGGNAENPNNWVWTLRSVNQIKGEHNMDYLFVGKGGVGKPKKGAWAGVNSINDLDAYENDFRQAQIKAAEKDSWGDRAKSETFMSEFAANRRGVIDSFKGAGVIKYVAMALGNQPVPGETPGLNFPQEQKRDGERNSVKHLLNPITEFRVGSVKGRMSLGLWIAENYPDLPNNAKLRIKQIYNECRLQLKRNENPYAQTASGFAKVFAEQVNDYLESVDLDL